MGISTQDTTDALGFAERLMTVLLHEGKFSATYKFAVLLALMDLCLEHFTSNQTAPTSITTRQLAEKVLELYWQHVLPFGSNSTTVLRQNNGGQAEILTLIQKFRANSRLSKSSIWNCRSTEPKLFRKLVDDIEWKLIEMPLPRLQKGKNDVRFMYQISWGEGIKRIETRRPEFDNRILLVDGAGDFLIRLNGLLRPFIQRRWAETVARFNVGSVNDYRLEEFLFGVSRESLVCLSYPLRELQENRCFYCGDRLGSSVDIDHFIPWTRYANNDIENLVAVDPLCNNNKRDYYASCCHLEAWSIRNLNHSADLLQISSETNWPHNEIRSMNVATALYLQIPSGTKLWLSRSEFEEAIPAKISSILKSAIERFGAKSYGTYFFQ